VSTLTKGRITYYLSESGRRDSLRNGGDGKRLQHQTGLVRSRDLDLFTVDREGQVWYDATDTPEKYVNEKCSTRVATSGKGASKLVIEWDVLPSWEELIEFARWLSAVKQREADEMAESYFAYQDEKEAAIKAFLEDPQARASRIDGDSVTIGEYTVSREEPAGIEAHKRAEFDRQKREETIRATVHAWIADNGTENQRQRMIAGVLPWKEAQTTVEESLFAPLRDCELYQRFDASTVCVCQFDNIFDAPATCKVQFQSVDACELNADEWESYSFIQKAVPSAQFQLREHRAKCESRAEPLIQRGVIVKLSVGSVVFKREYAL
jgi:hypothetical protein